MNNEKFTPVIRFAVMSDIHLKDTHEVEHDRFIKGINDAYKIAQSSEEYKNLDALVMVGDFANSGSEPQFLAAKKIIDENIKEGTTVIASIASHEYNQENGGVEGANEKLKRIMGMEPDTHQVINGFHFVSISPSHSCCYNEGKVKWMAENLRQAREDAPEQPIFVFQHPHVTDTVYGSIYWGDDDLMPAYVDYPQIVDFSGHSHCPINDPRSVHQDHFTCFGTGSLSYFELDEFDKFGGTCPFDKDECAQMLIVEADAQNRVRVYPYDIITGNFFPFVWKIDEPTNPDSFLYTDEKRYAAALKPYFKEGSEAKAENITEKGAVISFPQAVEDDLPFVNCYDVTVRNDATGLIESVHCIWSSYYLYNMPKRCSVPFENLKSGTAYTATVKARGFFKNTSSNSITVKFTTK